MAVLATLKKDRLGEWATLAEYLADLRRKETNSVAALVSALSSSPEEQRELAQGNGLAVLVEIASDLRLPKGARLAAARCSVEANASGPTERAARHPGGRGAPSGLGAAVGARGTQVAVNKGPCPVLRLPAAFSRASSIASCSPSTRW